MAELVEIVLAERQYRSNGYLSTSFMVHADDDDDDDTTLIIYIIDKFAIPVSPLMLVSPSFVL